ncbi:putative gag-pol polyprotein, partial [Tanacetum coccineum]
ENVEHERRLEGKKRIKTWSKLKECMKKRFVPHSYKQELYIQISSLKLGTKEVVDYIWEFEQLKIRTNVREAEEYTIARFIGGLNSTIAEKLKLQPLWTFEDACKMATTLETKGKENIGEGSKDPKGKKCFKCHGFGHFQAQCPNQRALTLKEIEDLQGKIETEDEQPVFDESNEEETVEADYGDILVVRRAMHTVEAPKDKTQRENIFHSRCTVKGKVFYHDEITCDVLPIDACHLVLDRPWLFDKHVYHNGHLNTYSIFINGKKITLTSLKPNEISKVKMNTKSDKVLFMSQKELVKELESGTYVLALLMFEKDKEKKGYNVPSLVKPLLSKFANVFPKELPPSLPPIREIKH